MLLDVGSIADFSKYYGGRWIKGKDNLPYFCRAANRDEIAANRIVVYKPKTKLDEWKTETVHFAELQNRFLFGIYPLGTIAIDDELLYFTYTPTREGYRGIDPRRICAFSFNARELVEQNVIVFDITQYIDVVPPSQIRKLMFPERYTFQKGAELVVSGEEVAVAFVNPNYGMYQSLYDDAPYFTYKKEVIGSFVQGRLLLTGSQKIPFVGLMDLLSGIEVVPASGDSL